MFAPILRLKEACAVTLRPPPGMTAAQVRKNGAVATALGLVLVLLLGVTPLALESLHVQLLLVSRGLLALMLLAYALFVVGGYRLLTGKGREQTHYGASASLGRIAFGVLFVFGSMAVLTGILILVAYAAGAS